MYSHISRPIPERWLGCPPYGDLVNSTFKPMKTMLNDNFHMDPRYKFTPELMMTQMGEENIDIGLVINLTQSKTRYDPRVFTNKYGINFEQIVCHGAFVPGEEQTLRFIEVCRTFLANQPNKIIAVHCTHGFNRTGFMISSYLCTQRGWSIGDAIEHFAIQRKPGIYKQDFVDCLFRLLASWRHRGPIPQVGPTPTWEVNSIMEEGTKQELRPDHQYYR